MVNKTSFYAGTGVTPTESNAIQSSVDAAAASKAAAATSAAAAATSATSSASSASTALGHKNAITTLTTATGAAGSTVAYNSGTGVLTVPRGNVGATGANSTVAGPRGPTGAAGQDGSGSGDMLKSNNLSDLVNAGTARTNLGLGSAATSASSAFATAAQGTLAANAFAKAGGALSGAVTTNSTFDGRNVSVDGTKLDNIATNANNFTNANAVSAIVASDLNMNGNKVLFGNMYAGVSDLPSASTYHGMFAHVHATGLAYYAHANAWVSLAKTSDLASVGDGGLTTNDFTNADHTKLNAIASSANNYTHPNHSGEVTSSADGATAIAAGVVDEANLKVSNSPTNGYFLSAQSGNAGGLTWAAVIGGATNGLFYENDQAVASSYTIVSAKNAMTTGPITINNNVTVTVENGGRWVVL